MRDLGHRFVLLAACAPFAMAAGVASAQTASTLPQSDVTQARGVTPPTQVAQRELPSSDESVADIVVTAQRREQSLRDVPVAIQAFSGAALVTQGVKSASDILLQVPSASYASYSPTQAILQLRGISQNAAVDPSVAYYVDEVPFSFPGNPYAPNVDALDLQRIEVLRGPQGTLYGLGAMGGTLRVITMDPELGQGYKLRFSGETGFVDGGTQSYQASGALNIPLSDTLAARVAVSYRHTGGWIEDAARGEKDINPSDTLSIRAKLLYKPTEALKVRLTVWRNETDQRVANISTFRDQTTLATSGGPGSPITDGHANFTIVSGFVSYDIGFATIENGLNYYKGRSPARFVIGTPGGILDDDTLDRTKAITNELRVVSNGETPFQWIVGGFYRDADRSFSENATFGGFPFLVNSKQAISSKSYAVFAEASYGLADDLARVLIGGRYFRDARDTLLTDDIQGTILDAKPKFSSFNPRLNVTVKPVRNVTIYGNIAKGFRSGANNTSGGIAGAALSGVTGIAIVQPDKIWTYEGGVKTDLFNKTVYLELAAYHSDWSNVQLQGATPNGFSFTVNGGAVKINGVEGQATWSTPLRGFSLSANASYAASKFSNVSPLVANASPLFRNGAFLPTIPKYSGSVSANYDAPLAATDIRILAGASYTFRGSQSDQGGADFDSTTPGVQAIVTRPRQELSLRAGVRKDEWELTAFATNVTNNQRSVSSLTSFQWFQPIPRTIGVRFSGGF